MLPKRAKARGSDRVGTFQTLLLNINMDPRRLPPLQASSSAPGGSLYHHHPPPPLPRPLPHLWRPHEHHLPPIVPDIQRRAPDLHPAAHQSALRRQDAFRYDEHSAAQHSIIPPPQVAPSAPPQQPSSSSAPRKRHSTNNNPANNTSAPAVDAMPPTSDFVKKLFRCALFPPQIAYDR